MKKISLLFCLLFAIGITLETYSQANFETSLHKTRNGKPTWYNAENGGFETLTNVPVEELGCVECHDAVDANGDPYPPDYTPDCVDCHATNSAWEVTQGDCLGCHSREASIINNPAYSDVHRTAGFVCMDCHKKEELHGDDGNEYASFFEPGAVTTDCSNSGCHEGFTHPGGQDPHNGALHCTSCHAETNLACYNCHFESQVVAHLKRPVQQITGFIMLVNRTKDGKVHPATFQSLSYEGNTWIAMGPSVAHTIVKEGARTCTDCHSNMGGQVDAIIDYNDDGVIQFASWNTSDSTLSWLNGIVPIPADYLTSFKMDFLTYNGDPNDPVVPSKNWSFIGNEADGFQLLYATPLTPDQMAAIGMDTTGLTDIKTVNSVVPDKFSLEQNYPNPFNPETNIRYSIPEQTNVRLAVYDAIGNLVAELVNEELPAGTYEVNFNAEGLSSGIYFYQINAGEFKSTRKLILMK